MTTLSTAPALAAIEPPIEVSTDAEGIVIHTATYLDMPVEYGSARIRVERVDGNEQWSSTSWEVNAELHSCDSLTPAEARQISKALEKAAHRAGTLNAQPLVSLIDDWNTATITEMAVLAREHGVDVSDLFAAAVWADVFDTADTTAER